MQFKWTKRAIEHLTWRTLDGAVSHAISKELGCIERTVRDMQWELELIPRPGRCFWTEEEKRCLAELYPMTPMDELVDRLGRKPHQIWSQAKKLGLRRSVELIAAVARAHMSRPDHGGRRTQFRKGQTPANKGTRRHGWAPGRMRDTQFKPGQRSGKAAENWMPVGSIRPDPEGYLRIKVREAGPGERRFGFGNTAIWPLMQRYVWVEHQGPIPPNHVICFIDGDRANCAIENLEIVSRVDLMKRNTIHGRYPKNVVDTIILLGQVKRKVREYGEKHNDRFAQPSI